MSRGAIIWENSFYLVGVHLLQYNVSETIILLKLKMFPVFSKNLILCDSHSVLSHHPLN